MSFRKKMIAGLMLSTVTLSALAPITPLTQPKTIQADSLDDQIASANKVLKDTQASSEQVQASINTLQSQLDAANAQLKDLATQSATTSAQITALNTIIVQRGQSLQNQARSAQTNGTVTNYLNTILNAKSLPDMIQKIAAMSQVVSANNDMMQQQKKDKASLEAKQVENQKAYAEATKLQQTLAVQQNNLAAMQAQYQATIATTQDQRDGLLAQKAAAEQAAAAEAAKQAQIAQQAQAAAAQLAAQRQSNGTVDGISASSSTVTNLYSTSGTAGNPYPYGQCTWGVYEILGGHMPIYKGNAADWAAYANASSPAPGEIVVFSPGAQGADSTYGHVGVVTSVQADGTFTISEANFGGSSSISSRTGVTTQGVSFINPNA